MSSDKSKSVQPIGEARVAACPLCGIQLREKALTYRELYCESCEKEFYVKAPASGKFAEHKSETQTGE
jgi:hypothetical protein